MGTHAIKQLAFAAAELSSVPTVHFFWKNDRSPARRKRTGGVQQKVTVKAAVAVTDQIDHLTFGSNASLKDDCFGTLPTVDHHGAQYVPKLSSSWTASLCDNLEKKVMSWALGYDTCDKKECYLLSENYALVEEMAPTADLPIAGTIPVCMWPLSLFSFSWYFIY
jgi:hypothetical protein